MTSECLANVKRHLSMTKTFLLESREERKLLLFQTLSKFREWPFKYEIHFFAVDMGVANIKTAMVRVTIPNRHFCACTLFQVLSTVLRNKVNCSLSARKAALWYMSFLQKFGNNILCCVTFTLEAPIQGFSRVSKSSEEQCRGCEKYWTNSTVITKVRRLGSLTYLFWWEKNFRISRCHQGYD